MRAPLLASVIAAFSLTILATPAAASANFGCRANDRNIVSLELEGVTPRDGSNLVAFSATLELSPGQKIIFGKGDVTKFIWNRTIRLGLRKQLSRRSFVEVHLRTQPGEEDLIFPGTYVLRTERLRLSGAVTCEGG